MIEILSSSRSENKEISCISTCNCYFDFYFYLAANSLDFTKEKFSDSYYFYHCNHLTVSCFDTLKFLISFHIRQPEDCYKLSNLIAYDKMNCICDCLFDTANYSKNNFDDYIFFQITPIPRPYIFLFSKNEND